MGSDDSPDNRSGDSERGETGQGEATASSATADADSGTGDAPSGRTMDQGGGDEPVSINALFEILASPGNRYVLSYVVREDGPVPYHDLVEYVVDRADTPPELTTAEFRNRIATRLVHSNLPKLDDAGLVEYDTAAGTVRETPATEVAVPYLELAMEQSLTY